MQRPQQSFGHRDAAEDLQHADLVPTSVDEGPDGLLERLGECHGVGVRIEHRRVAVTLDE